MWEREQSVHCKRWIQQRASWAVYRADESQSETTTNDHWTSQSTTTTQQQPSTRRSNLSSQSINQNTLTYRHMLRANQFSDGSSSKTRRTPGELTHNSLFDFKQTVCLCGFVLVSVAHWHSARWAWNGYQPGLGSIPRPGRINCFRITRVHALRLISGTGKRVWRCPL